MDYRRLSFCIFNALITIVSLAAVVLGGLTTANPNYVAILLASGSNTLHSLDYRTRIEFYIFWRDVDVANVEIYRRAGICLIVLGCFLSVISVLGWCVWRLVREPSLLAIKLLFIYVLLMAVLATIQVGLTADFYAWLSRLPARMREYYQTNTIASNYSPNYDEYSQTINILHYVFDCCGIFEHGDFGNPRNLPPSCCKSWIISGGNYSMKYACRQGTAPTDYYSQQGCYEQAQLTIPKNLAIIGSITALILLLQVVQAFLGVLLLRNPENARVAPIEDGQIKPAATSSHLPVVKTPSPSTVCGLWSF